MPTSTTEKVASLVMLLLVTATAICAFMGCGRKSQVIDVVYEGNWDSGEIKSCSQFDRRTLLPAHESALLCGSLYRFHARAWPMALTARGA